MSDPLRGYQAAALDAARARYRAGDRRVLLVGPTGCGKTRIFAEIVRGHVAKRGRVLVVVHRRELLRQAVARMRREGVERVGVLIADEREHLDAPVVVASIQTMIGVPEADLPAATLVVFDEAHHFVADEWGRVAAHYAAAKIVGVTATPERGDGTPLGDLFDSLVPIASVRDLVAEGYLVPCRVIAPLERTKALARDPIEAWREYGRGRPTVVFCASVAAARTLAQRLASEDGVRAACVDGGTDAAYREACLDAFAAGELDVLTNVYCLTEGWDCPRAEVAILARGFTHAGTYLQVVGRVLRPHPGKDLAVVVDLRGAVHAHGLPDEDRTFSLEGKAISGGDGEAPSKVGPSCSSAVAAAQRTCAFCGYEFPSAGVEVEDRELVTVSRVDAERAYWDEQRAIARRRGYALGWVAHRWAEKFGRFPRKFWREETAA